ncbi:MAG: DoxX family protein [Sandaracinaceae bacterium]|nr:DoxX family protein [Sandaracinaceae bacterium]
MSTVLRHAPTAARVVLGLAFLVFGLNGFLGFLPMPPHEGGAGAFLGALAATGYMFPLIKGTEVLVGALLLGNRFVPLALTLLAPVMVNILAFHAVLEPAGVALPVVLLGLQLFLAWAYRRSYVGVLAAKARPEAPAFAASEEAHATA